MADEFTGPSLRASETVLNAWETSLPVPETSLNARETFPLVWETFLPVPESSLDAAETSLPIPQTSLKAAESSPLAWESSLLGGLRFIPEPPPLTLALGFSAFFAIFA